MEFVRIGPLLLVAFAAAFVVSTAHAEADGPDFYDVRGVREGHSLRLRAEPSTGAEVLARIPFDGTCLQNRGCQGGLTFEEFTTLSEAERREIERTRPRWCRVGFGELEGWVAGRFVRESSSACPAFADASGPAARYRCDGLEGELEVRFADGDPPSASARLGARAWAFRQVPAASGAKYEGASPEELFWSKGETALFRAGADSPQVSCTKIR